MFTARVPGFGLVEWVPEQVEAYALELAQIHRSERLSIQWRGRGILRLPVLAGHVCRSCSKPWPCHSARWASRYEHSQARAITDSLR